MPYLVLCTTAHHNHCTTGQLAWQASNYDLGNITCQRLLGLQIFTIWAPMIRMNLSWQLVRLVMTSLSLLRPLKTRDQRGPKEPIAFTRLVVTAQTVCILCYSAFVHS